MCDILLTILIISLWCNGVYIITSEGQLGYPVRELLHKVFNKEFIIPKHKTYYDGKRAYWDWGIYCTDTWIKGLKKTLFKPLIGCITCMASIHGAYVYIFLHGLDWNLILCCVCAAWLNPVLYAKYDS